MLACLSPRFRRTAAFAVVSLFTLFAPSHGDVSANEVDKPTSEEQWKTVFYKRGFMGAANPNWYGGLGSTIRYPIPLQIGGSKARIWVQPARNMTPVLAKASLVRAAEQTFGELTGATAGEGVSFTFNGTPEVTIPSDSKPFPSDAAAGAITPGLWYLESTYSGEEFVYAYDADGVFMNDLTQGQSEVAIHKKGSLPGQIFRVDLLTNDRRPVLLCYGDSITHGAGSTPLSGNRYPTLLAKMLDRPTLNGGVNGDLARYSGGIPGLVNSLEGIDSVILLMGINDIISANTDFETYKTTLERTLKGLASKGVRIYLGTLPPASGWKNYDETPEKEEVRNACNEWIRSAPEGVTVIDFDKALLDPSNPKKIKEEYQADWLHPNDAGYQKMAETAAAKVRETEAALASQK